MGPVPPAIPDYVPPLAASPFSSPLPDYRPSVPGELPPVESLSPALQEVPPAPTGGQLPEVPGAEPEPRLRVQLAGRVGAAPSFRTTPKGTLVAKFPLGVHEDPDSNKTSWHQVLAFGKRAEMVRESLRRGDAIEVIGYWHTRQIPGKNGPRTVEEIYATVVHPR